MLGFTSLYFIVLISDISRSPRKMTTRGMGTGPMHCKKGVLIATERHLQKYLTQDIASQPMVLGIPNGSHGFKVMV